MPIYIVWKVSTLLEWADELLRKILDGVDNTLLTVMTTYGATKGLQEQMKI